MTTPDTETDDFGIRVSLPEGDPFTRLLSAEWKTIHWFASQTARDLALHDMSRQHEYSRKGDQPALVFEPIERNGNTN
jgi:hypothetical protein